MNRDAVHIQKMLNTAWDAVKIALDRMYPASEVRPSTASAIFGYSGTNAEVKFEVKPIVFRVPEKATLREANLYIAVKGWLSFEGPNYRTNILTKSFGTEVGYFRLRAGSLDHVYGAHYDLDENKPGHPVFHSQITPQMSLLDDIKSHFRKDWNGDDHVNRILSNVRTPSAQMDVFSVIAQICADHLMHSGSAKEVQEAFLKMRKACDFFKGAAHRMNYMNSSPAPECYRSTHWYAGSPPPATNP